MEMSVSNMPNTEVVYSNPLAGIIGLITITAMWFVMEKCGAPGWNSLIPIRNLWCLAKIATTDDELARKVIRSQVPLLICTLLLFPLIILGISGSDSAGILLFVWFVVFFGFAIWAIVVEYQVYVRLARAFNKPKSWGVGLLLLQPVFLGILAWHPESVYHGPVSD